MISIKFH